MEEAEEQKTRKEKTRRQFYDEFKKRRSQTFRVDVVAQRLSQVHRYGGQLPDSAISVAL